MIACGLLVAEPWFFSRCGAPAYLLPGMWDFSCLTRDQTCVPCIGRHVLNHWMTREVPADCDWVLWRKRTGCFKSRTTDNIIGGILEAQAGIQHTLRKHTAESCCVLLVNCAVCIRYNQLYILALILRMSLIYMNIIISSLFYERVNWGLEEWLTFPRSQGTFPRYTVVPEFKARSGQLLNLIFFLLWHTNSHLRRCLKLFSFICENKFLKKHLPI